MTEWQDISTAPMVDRVGQALRAACREEYGSDWNNDVAWKFARAAIQAMMDGATDELIAHIAKTIAWQVYSLPPHNIAAPDIEVEAVWGNYIPQAKAAVNGWFQAALDEKR